MTITTMIRRAAAGLLLALVATGLTAKDDKRPGDGQPVKVRPEIPVKVPDPAKTPVYSVPEPAGLALLSVGLGAVGLSMMLRRRKRR